jgi:hypothetical protein
MAETTDRMAMSPDPTRFDRLVDGELSRDEYRALLAALDDEPGGWRRCALAFLEAQALASDLTEIRGSQCLGAAPLTVGPAPGARPAAGAARPAGWHGRAFSLLAIAASFLVVFCLGLAAPRIFRLAQQELAATGNDFTRGPLVRDVAPAQPPTGADELPREVGNVRLVVDSADGDREAGQVPVYEVGDGLEQLLAADRPVLAPELIELLRQRGYDVQRQQQFFPAPLDDGRQIIVPVEGYQITPVSRRY